MPRSAIRQIMQLAAGRPEVIHLEVGEPDQPTPAHIVESAARALKEGWTRYSPNAGLPSLRAMVAARASVSWGNEVDPARVVITTGAVGALYSAVASVVDPGDEILIPDPGWPNYESIAHLTGAAMVRYPLSAENGFLPDMDDVRRRTTGRTKAIIVNSPCNPTGAVFPRELMRSLVEHVRICGAYLISDEVYENIVFEGSHVSAGEFWADDRVLVISGVSKSYAMTGFRLGWLIGPEALATVAAGLQEPITSCPSAVAQKAAEAALAGDQSCVRALCQLFQRRRDMVVETIGQSGLLPVVPAGAFYALIDIGRTGMGSLRFCLELLEEQAVAAVPGVTFGPNSDRYIRIALTAPDAQLREGLGRITSQIRHPR